MLEEGRLEADPKVGLLPVTVLLYGEDSTLGLSATLPLRTGSPLARCP